MSAQLEYFLSSGFMPAHLDSHHHIHAEEVILPTVLKLARMQKIVNLGWEPDFIQALGVGELPVAVYGLLASIFIGEMRTIHDL